MLYCGVGGEVGAATVAGTKGRIEFPGGFFNASGFVLHRKGSDPEVIEFEPAGLHYQAAGAGRCLRAGLIESPLVPWDAMLAVMSTLDAIRAPDRPHLSRRRCGRAIRGRPGAGRLGWCPCARW